MDFLFSRFLSQANRQTLQTVKVSTDHQLPLNSDIVDSRAKNQGPKVIVYPHLNLPMSRALMLI